MLTVDDISPDEWLSTWLGLKAAKDCIHIWNNEHPRDKRPSEAIEAAEAWLNNPCKKNCDAKLIASGHAMISADRVYTIYGVAYMAAYVALGSLTKALNYAALSLGHKGGVYSDAKIKEYLDFIIDYKIENNQSFGDFEAVFEAASEAYKEKLLFHMNINEERG